MAAGVALVVGGCAAPGPARDGDGPGSGGPTVRLIDSVVLAAPDTAELGEDVYLALDRRGTVFVAARTEARVVSFWPDGSLRWVSGRRGGGPGEFLGPASLGLVAEDSLVGIIDAERSYLSVLEAATGRYLRGFPVVAREVGGTWSIDGSRVTFAAVGRAQLAATWSWRSDRLDLWGATPPHLFRAMPAYLYYGKPEVLPDGTGWIALLPTDPGLRLFDREGRPTYLVRLPVRRRRGTPEGFLEASRPPTISPGESLQPRTSYTATFGRLGDGTLLVAYLDVDQIARNDPVDPKQAVFGNFRFFVSLVSKDLRTACPDAKLPIPGDRIAPPVLRGDTLTVYARGEVDGVDRPVLRHYVISAAGCRWIDTGRRLPDP